MAVLTFRPPKTTRWDVPTSVAEWPERGDGGGCGEGGGGWGWGVGGMRRRERDATGREEKTRRQRHGRHRGGIDAARPSRSRSRAAPSARRGTEASFRARTSPPVATQRVHFMTRVPPPRPGARGRVVVVVVDAEIPRSDRRCLLLTADCADRSAPEPSLLLGCLPAAA
eukprot:31200-Pelagococcus_subviridis.AAC.2